MEHALPRKILLGITGGIAAYKAPYLVRALVKAGAEVPFEVSALAVNWTCP